LIRQQLTRVELAINSPETISSALKNAKIAAQALPESALSWHNLAVAQGRNGNIAMANLSLAELALLQNNMHKAALHASRAKKVLKENTPAYQRSIDIINTSKKTKKNQR
jgi:predicted Zn-dependent protease